MTARAVIVAAVVAIAGTTAYVLARAPAQPASPPRAARPPAVAAPRVIAVDPAERPRAPAPIAGEPAAPVKLGAAQRVATVNGTVITGRQLLAWRGRDPDKQEMTPQMFAALKSRAIERELTFAEARRQGIDLGPAQRQQLDDVRSNARARGETDADQLDFEETDARAHLLAAALLEKSGVSAPFATDADVKRYYDAHQDELGDLPADPEAHRVAWNKLAIEIRQVLAVELQAQHQQRVSGYFDQLRAAAQITD
ncbi:MAG: hypothetical protein E6J90_06585 [Deltaproteobacteria bacterium]|nr:MAG: hypothetical protein E6J91_21200 [Deltaproteobacteria bacterium]TMQ25108.1 MAG: hypothetical protein E6J90_06585 [Deltaproteobacteria bacterium]